MKAKHHSRLYSGRRRASSGGTVIGYLSPLLAVIVGIVHAALAPVIAIGDVKPNIVLVAVVLVTCLAGFLPGITWAFVAGLTANLLVSAPLGSIPLGLLVVAALTAGGARLLGRMVWIYPVSPPPSDRSWRTSSRSASPRWSTDASVTRSRPTSSSAAAVLNAAICAIALVPARLISTRWATDEAGAW